MGGEGILVSPCVAMLEPLACNLGSTINETGNEDASSLVSTCETSKESDVGDSSLDAVTTRTGVEIDAKFAIEEKAHETDMSHDAKGSVAAAWLCDGAVGHSECERRRVCIRQVCARLLAVAPQHRPRTLKSFGNMTRHARTVRSYTVKPAALVEALDDVLDFSSDMHQELINALPDTNGTVERLEPRRILQARSRWLQMRRDSVRITPAGAAAWFLKQAFIEKQYEACEVFGMLSDLGFAQSGCADSIDCTLVDVASTVLRNDGEQRLKLTFSLPPGCPGGVVVGKHGVNIRPYRESCLNDVNAKILERHSSPEGMLKLVAASEPQEPRILRLDFRVGCTAMETNIRWENCSQEVVQRAVNDHVRKHLFALQHSRLRKSWAKYKEVQNIWWKDGKAYQSCMEERRSECRAKSSAERALHLPEADTRQDISSCARIKHFQKSKIKARWRRQEEVREKRKLLLRASSALEHQQRSDRGTAEANRGAQAITTVTDDRINLLKDSSHLERLRVGSLGGLRGQVRRLQKNINQLLTGGPQVEEPATTAPRVPGHANRRSRHSRDVKCVRGSKLARRAFTNLVDDYALA